MRLLVDLLSRTIIVDRALLVVLLWHRSVSVFTVNRVPTKWVSAMDVFEVIEKRRSIRRFRPDPVIDEYVEKL